MPPITRWLRVGRPRRLRWLAMITATQISAETTKATAARRSVVGIDSAGEQALTVEGRVDAEGEQTCGKEAEDDAADDPPTACDQAESGDSSSGHRQGDGSPERPRRRRCFGGGTRRCGRCRPGAASSTYAVPLVLASTSLYVRPEWKPAPQYVPDRLNMRLPD